MILTLILRSQKGSELFAGLMDNISSQISFSELSLSVMSVQVLYTNSCVIVSILNSTTTDIKDRWYTPVYVTQ